MILIATLNIPLSFGNTNYSVNVMAIVKQENSLIKSENYYDIFRTRDQFCCLVNRHTIVINHANMYEIHLATPLVFKRYPKHEGNCNADRGTKFLVFLSTLPMSTNNVHFSKIKCESQVLGFSSQHRQAYHVWKLKSTTPLRRGLFFA